MSILRRYPSERRPVFITMVTLDRQPVLLPMCVLLLGTFRRMELLRAWKLMAWVILPDHVHLIVLPQSGDISSLVHRAKMIVSTRHRSLSGYAVGRLWQHRFYDHIIRNQEDLNRHLDYVHYNPVKHGVSVSPGTYQFSSFAQFLADDKYEPNWGEMELFDGKDFGE